MKKVKVISVTVSFAGLIEIVAWIFDLMFLKSISPAFVTMKFSTALCFFFSGVTLFFIAEAARGETAMAQAVLPATTLVILLFMLTLLTSSLIGVNTGVETLFVREPTGAVMTTVPGRPSLMTMFDFILIASTGIAAMFRPSGFLRWLRYSGIFIALTGVSAALGYAFNSPLMFFAFPGVSTAMALNTALLFLLLGFGFIFLSGFER